ncbi:Alpha-alpha-trehalose-phosphate synthase subunit [Penicillium sp. DV-2018c]|nr:Alpha-alpha-trehalose-phosphate synthase subunit [Penicillium sp. DV-2018c]
MLWLAGNEVGDSKDRENVEKSWEERNGAPILLSSLDSTMARLNEPFADAVLDAAEFGTLIWVHEYYLVLLPERLRDRLKARDKTCPISFSLPTMFPAKDFWGNLPGLLSSDLVGFHIHEYKQNFFETCGGLLFHASDARPQVPHQIQYKNRPVCVSKSVIGIDPEKFARIESLKERHIGIKVIICVDRLDHIKKLNGFDAFIDDRPEQQNKVVLIQISVPSHEEANECNELETKLCTLAGKINGRYAYHSATPEGTPLLYMHRLVPFDELTALYYVADVCLLTSALDGMDRVAFEYVACQKDRHDALVLSEIAGTASFMGNDSTLSIQPTRPRRRSHFIYEDRRKAKYEHLRDSVDANTRFEILFLHDHRQPLTSAVLNGSKPSLKSCLLIANGQKTHVDPRLLLQWLFSGTQAQELKACMRCHKKSIRFASLDLLGLEKM